MKEKFHAEAASTITLPFKTSDDVARAYQSEPWWYDLRGLFILTFAYNSGVLSQLRFFGRNMAADHLELGCGTGTLLALALRWRRFKRLPEVRIVGVDYAESMLAGAVKRFRGRPGVKFRHGDAAALPLRGDSFDSVNIANALHCFPEVDAALRSAFRVLKPGGTLAANVLLPPRGPWPLRWLAGRINAWGIRKGILQSTYAEEDVRRRLALAGFLVESASVSGNCLNVSARKPP